jgi:hypothetical protein
LNARIAAQQLISSHEGMGYSIKICGGGNGGVKKGNDVGGAWSAPLSQSGQNSDDAAHTL